MARRPDILSDRDNWGAVLNDYLDVSLAEDGTIKDTAAAALPVSDATQAALDAKASTVEVEGVQSQVNALGADIDAIANAPSDLLVTSDLFAHWDATSISAIDQSRVSSWLDEVASHDAAQATGGNQPLYDIIGINGNPALYFDNSRDDNLLATSLEPTSSHVTVFAVVKGAAPPSGARYAFGTNGHPKNIFLQSTNRYRIQGSSTPEGVGVTDQAPYIVSGVFNGASSLIRANGIQVDGDVGTQTTLPTTFSIGHRTALTEGQGFEGHIGEVLYYDRVLTAGEITSVETYLSAKWGIPVTPQSVWYVDSVLGSATGSGRTPSTAVNSYSTAMAAIIASGAPDATMVIHAPEDRPLRETQTFVDVNGAGQTVRLVSKTPGQPWYLYGSQRFEGGWTHDGSGVYSQAVTIDSDTSPVCWVPDLMDGDGQPTRIYTRNTTTPTTPAAGEYGYSGGTYYLHLTGDIDPNDYAIEIATCKNLALVANGATLVIQDGVLRGTQSGNVKVGNSSGAVTGSGTVIAIDCTSEYSGDSGWMTNQYVTRMTCYRCVGRYHANDGFNHHCVDGVNAPIMELVDCEGSYNDDEGVSPHETSRLILRGGRYHHNSHGGLTSVGSSVVQLFATEFYENRLHDSTTTGWDSGGVSILHASRLISTDLYSHDHPGPGVEIDTAGGATWIDNGGTRSGIEHGNGAADVT